jgi:hypothetical protein
MDNALLALQAWYLQQCDGEWEHTYGISITTLDNPGWGIEIDLTETILENRQFSSIRVRRNEIDNWYECRVTEQKFKAYCGPLNMEEVVREFLAWANRSATALK